MAVDVGSARGFLDLDISGFLSGLRSAQEEAKSAQQDLSNTLGDGLTAVGGKLTSAGKTLTAAVTTPIIGMGTAAVKTSSTFESGMSQIQATMGITKDSMSTLNGESVNTMDALGNLAKQMGASTKFSATEAADAINILAMAGYDTEKIYGSLPNILNLAAAGNLGIAESADIATGVMSGFGLKAEDSAMVADKIAMMASSAKGSVAEFGTAMATAAGQAQVTGQSFDDTAVALEVLGNHNLSGAEAGNALNRVLKNLYQPTEQAAKAMEEFGISAYDSQGKARALPDVLQDLNGKLDGLTDEEKNDILGKIFDSATLKSVPFLINDCTEAWDTQDDSVTSLIEGIRGASDAYGGIGAASGQAEAQMDNLSGQVTLLKSALEGVAIQIGDIVMPYVKKFVEYVQQLVDKFAALSPEQKEQVVKWAAIAAAVGPVLLGVGKLISGAGNLIKGFKEVSGVITKLKSGFSLLGSAIGGVSAPVVAIVAVIAVLIAAFVNLWKNNEEFREKITAIWDGIKEKFQAFAQGIVDRLNALGFDFQNITDVLKAIWDGFCELLAPVFEGVFHQIGVILGAALDVITGIFDVFIGIFTGNWDQAWQGVKEIFGAVWDLIKGTFESWATAFEGIVNTVLGWFGTNWEEVWTKVKDFFTNIWNGIKSFFEGIWNGISSFFTTVATAIRTTVTTVFTAISNFFSNIWNTIKSVFDAALTIIRNVVTTVFNAVWNFIQTIWNTIYNTIKTILDTIWQTISSVFDTIKNTITTILTTIWNTIQTIWNNILYAITLVVVAIQDVIKNIFGAIKDFLSGNVEECKNKLNNAWTTIKNFITEIVNTIRSTINTVFEAIKTIITTIMNAIQTVITTVWNAIKTVVDTVVNAIKTVINTVFEAIKTLITNAMNAIKTTIINVWDAIKTAVTNTVNAVKNTISTVFEAIKTAVTNAVNAAKTAATSAFDALKTGVTNTINALKTKVTEVFNGIKTAISGAMDSAKNLAVTAMTNAKNGVVNVWNGITDTFKNIGKNIIQGIINGIGDMVSSLYDSIENALSGLVNKAKSALGISSPSKVFKKEIGRWLPGGIADGFVAAMPEALDKMQDELDKMPDELDAEPITVDIEEEKPKLIGDDLKSTMASVFDYYKGMEERLAEVVSEMRKHIEAIIYMADGVDVSSLFGKFMEGEYGASKRNAGADDFGQRGGGKDTGNRTYVFYTTKAIDEIEAARQMRRTERDMSEGFA